MLTNIQKGPRLLIGEVICNSTDLIDQINKSHYICLDSQIPVCRFRGTQINRFENGWELVGWQRNVSRMQKMDVSLPTIIHLKLDLEKRISSICLDSNFAGSKGLLCNHKYLEETLAHELYGQKIDDCFYKKIFVEKLHCFHLTEILGGIISALQLMEEHGEVFLYEEEALDAYVDDGTLCIAGIHYFSHLSKAMRYEMKFKNALELVKFNETGAAYTNEPIDSTFLLEDNVLFSDQLIGDTEKRLCVKIKSFSLKGMISLKKSFTQDKGNSFMCSNLFPQAFIGLFIQAAAMKIFNNNMNYVMHCLNGIQRYNNKPRCIGAIDSQDDVSKYFPKYDLSQIFV